MVLWDLMNHYISSSEHSMVQNWHSTHDGQHCLQTQKITAFLFSEDDHLASRPHSSNLCWFSCQRPASEEAPLHTCRQNGQHSGLVILCPETRQNLHRILIKNGQKPYQILKNHVHWVGDAIQPSHPLLSPSPASIFPSTRVFSNELVLHIRWAKDWSLNFSMSHANEYSGCISFSIDWFDLAVQGTLKSLLQHHSSKISILQCSASFMVQLWKNHSFDYMDLCWQSNYLCFLICCLCLS